MKRLCVVLFLCGCPGPTPPSVDGGMTTSALLDTDGDGLTDRYETRGWDVSVNSTGYADRRENRHVTSDPTKVDSDSDGLTDSEELLARTDPNGADTDGDGLPDFAEVKRWLTSPVSVDSDSDSRGAPGENLPPLFSLFDGAELQLVMVNGRAEPGPHATSPLRADTDGDGRSDRDEVVAQGRANVADRPRLQIELSPNTQFGLALDVTYGDQQDEDVTYAFTDTGAHTLSTSVGGSLTASANVYVGFGFENTVSGGLGGDGLSGSDELKLTQKAGVEAESTLTGTFSQSATNAFTQTQSTVANRSRTLTSELTGARMTASVDFVNVGTVPFTVRGPAVGVTFWTPTRGRVPLATLNAPPTAPESITLAPGARTALALEDLNVDPTRMLALMAAPYSLEMTPVQTQLISGDGGLSSFQYENITQNTALLTFDKGDGPRAEYVAANVDRTDDGAVAGVSVATLLAAVDVTFETRPLDAGVAYVVDGVAPDFYPETGAPDVGTALGFVLAPPGPRRIKAGWFALITSSRSASGVISTGELGNVRVLPGEVVTLALLRDLDRDGLSSHEEMLLGTSDTNLDSDGDGLPDYWEAREGWEVSVTDRGSVVATRHVFPRGRSADSDGDSLSDARERMLGTDPLSSDTDGDNMRDDAELLAMRSPTDIDRAPPTIQTTGTPTVMGLNVTQALVVEDPNQDVNRIEFDWGDGSHETWRRGGAQHIERYGLGALAGRPTVQHAYAVPGFFTAHLKVIDALNDSAVVTLVFNVSSGGNTFLGGGVLSATSNSCNVNLAIEFSERMIRWPTNQVPGGNPQVDSISFAPRNGGFIPSVLFNEGWALAFADGTNLGDPIEFTPGFFETYSRPAEFPGPLPFSYANRISTGERFPDVPVPGSVGQNVDGVFEWDATNSDFPRAIFHIGSTSAPFPRRELSKAAQPTVHVRCVEAPLDLALDCHLALRLQFHQVSQAPPMLDTDLGDCSAVFENDIRFRRNDL